MAGTTHRQRWIDVRITGIAPLLRKLNKVEPVYAQPWTDALTEATKIAEAELNNWVPVRTGLTKSRIKTKMQARPVPLWAKVGVSPMPYGRDKGKIFRYPGALQGGARYHYRSGPHAGQQTKGWLYKPLEVLGRRIESLLQAAGEKVVRKWES